MRFGGATIADFSAASSTNRLLPIERRAYLDVGEFRSEYAVPRRPVIITDAAEAWPIYRRGTPEYFRSVYGNHPVRVFGRTCRLAALVDKLQQSTPEMPAPYPCKFEIAKDFRELLAEVTPRFAYSLPDWQDSTLVPQRLFDGVNNLEIFFGGPGGKFPYLHYDVMHLHAWITQLHGDKEFVLYPPGQEELLYVNPDIPWQSSMRGHHNPDHALYPLFCHARSQKIVIRAGETLFLPCGWWHTARSLNMTISVAFDQLASDNWSDFIADVVAERRRRQKYIAAFLYGTYLRSIGPALRLAERFGTHSTDWAKR